MLKKILGINFLLFAAYETFITASSAMENRGFNIAIGVGLCITIQVVLNVIAGIAFFLMGKPDAGKSLLISAAVLVPIGFITWLILLSIFG